MQKKFQEKIFLSSLKESVGKIRKNKIYFTLLFFTQLALIIIISAIFVNYSIKIGENMQEIIEPLQDFSATMIPEDAAAMLGNSEALSSAYDAMKMNIALLVLFSFIAYVIFGGINWNLANLIVNGREYPLLTYQLIFGISALFLTFVALLFSAFFLSFMAYVGNNQLAVLLGTVLLMGITYFSFISFALIHKYNLKQIKQLIKHTLQLGYKKFGTLSFSYAFMVLIIILFAGIVYLLLYSPMPALFFILILFILSMNWGKLYFLTTVNNVEKK